MSYTDEAVKALFSCASSAVTLLLAWKFGQRLSYHWNVRQKRREVQFTVSQQFYAAYGEFFAVWKIWNRLEKAAEYEDRRWTLHTRAVAAEAIIEGILVKLSTELPLDADQLETLGHFRYDFQQLRQVIRQDTKLPWQTSNNPDYVDFKTRTVKIAALLAGEWDKLAPTVSVASAQFVKITSNDLAAA